jgi:hypothetical protein
MDLGLSSNGISAAQAERSGRFAELDHRQFGASLDVRYRKLELTAHASRTTRERIQSAWFDSWFGSRFAFKPLGRSCASECRMWPRRVVPTRVRSDGCAHPRRRAKRSGCVDRPGLLG